MAAISPQPPPTSPVQVQDDVAMAQQTTFSGEDGPEPDSEYLTKADIERLGRQRPAIFRGAAAEVGFVTTVVMSMMMSEYFISGFNIILPPVSASLDIADSAQTWPAGVINLTTAALLLPSARLCDMYGGRVVFLSGQTWLLIWSVVCGFSQNSTMLVVCRAMQGIGASAFLPAGLALLGGSYRPGPRKNLIFSVWGAFASMGFYFGILLGSVCADYLTWRWYFWLGAIVCGAVIVGGFFFIPRHLGDIDPKARMDWLGLVTIVPGLVLIVYAFTDGRHAPDGWSTPYIYVIFMIGVLMLSAAVYTQGWVSAQPFLPPEIFRPKYMKRLVAALFSAYGVFGLYLFYASLHIENVLEISPILTAAWYTPLAIGGLCLALTGGFVLHLVSNHILMIISGLGMLLCVLLFALIPTQSDGNTPSNTFIYWAYVFPAMLGSTIGVDIVFNVTNIYVTSAVPKRLQATASGLLNSLLYLGIAFWLGVADLAISATERTQHVSLDKRHQYRIGFWTGVAVAGLSLTLLLTTRLGQASAEMTADEKAHLEHQQADRGVPGQSVMVSEHGTAPHQDSA